MLWSKKRRQESAAAEAAATLEPALQQLDMFSDKLDALRQLHNDTARELASIRPEPLPTPVVSFPVPGPPSGSVPVARIPRAGAKPSSPYAMINPPDPQPVRLPSPPQMTKKAPKRTHSGRFYIQVANAKDSGEFSKVREQLSKCGRIVDSGRGTASDPEAGWLEVAVRAEDTGSFVVKLEETQMKDRVEKMIQVEPGEGRVQARQLDLFRRKQDSKAGI